MSAFEFRIVSSGADRVLTCSNLFYFANLRFLCCPILRVPLGFFSVSLHLSTATPGHQRESSLPYVLTLLFIALSRESTLTVTLYLETP